VLGVKIAPVALPIFVNPVVELVVEDCHWIVPVFPVSDKAAGVTPAQMV
jgi:hypothetical protein